jgi:hypothetical protein
MAKSNKNNPRSRKNDIKTTAAKAVKGGRKKVAEFNKTSEQVRIATEAAAERKKADRRPASTSPKPGTGKRRQVSRGSTQKGVIDPEKAAATQAKGAAKKATLPKATKRGKRPTKTEQEAAAETRRKTSVRTAAQNLRDRRRDITAATSELTDAQKTPRHAQVLEGLKNDLLELVNYRHRPKPKDGKYSTKHPSDSEIEGYKSKLAAEAKTGSNKEPQGGGATPREAAQMRLDALTKAHDAVKKHAALDPKKYDADIDSNIERGKKRVADAQAAAKSAEDIRGNAKTIEAETVKREADDEVRSRKNRAEAKALANSPETKINKFVSGDIVDHKGQRVERWKFLKFPSARAMAATRRDGEAHQDFMARHTTTINEKINKLKDRAAKRKSNVRVSRPTISGVSGSKPLRDASNNPLPAKKRSAAEIKAAMEARTGGSTTEPAAKPGEVKSKQISDALDALGKGEMPR